MIRCPYCGESYYTMGYSMTTAMYYPPIYKNGVNVNPDGNYTTTNYHCMNCQHDFTVQTRYGEVVDIKDQGLKVESAPLDVNINDFDNTETGTTTINIDQTRAEIKYPWDILKEEVEEIKKRLDKLEKRVYYSWEQ